MVHPHGARHVDQEHHAIAANLEPQRAVVGPSSVVGRRSTGVISTLGSPSAQPFQRVAEPAIESPDIWRRAVRSPRPLRAEAAPPRRPNAG